MDNQPIQKYEHPYLTVDIIILTIRDDQFEVALIKRGIEPFKGKWAIPGGFVRMDESLEAAALRELEEETGVADVYLEQLYTFGDVGRDPRDRVVTVAYFALVPSDKLHLVGASDADDAQWFSVDKLPELAFDHAKVMQCAVDRVRSKLDYSTIAFRLLPDEFRLSELQRVYEIILGEPQDKRNFRKKILSLNLVEETGEKHAGASHRPAALYRFKDPSRQYF
ncbi:MAG TPA: NUDIX domain-containing protein [Verrucomicrobiae bacterium]|nr:NUDIX domain-containing protein [Verrucomicrobiae bacterium]